MMQGCMSCHAQKDSTDQGLGGFHEVDECRPAGLSRLTVGPTCRISQPVIQISIRSTT